MHVVCAAAAAAGADVRDKTEGRRRNEEAKSTLKLAGEASRPLQRGGAGLGRAV